jgi:nucleoside-diphosphate-sugar epimerase
VKCPFVVTPFKEFAVNILIIGGAGYVGKVVVDALHAPGERMTVADRFLFSRLGDLAPGVTGLCIDNRDLTSANFKGIDAVLDLAAISNDPAGELSPELTRAINHRARVRVSALARAAGVRRYLLFSSCSVYGACDSIVSEGSPTNPLTVYAKCNVLTERELLALNNAGFCVTAFRLATVFGPSSSMRFDLVVNTMTRNAYHNGQLTVSGGGEQYRPLVHVADVAHAARLALAAPTDAVGGEVFNIGATNMRMTEVATAVVAGINRPTEIVIDSSTIDNRNYRANFDKAEQAFGFKAHRTVEDGARAIFEGLRAGTLDEGPASIRLNGYRELVAGRSISAVATAPA